MKPATPPPDLDPMPRPPLEPEPDACCGRGCRLCVFDRYDLDMERYREALSAWRARHPDASPEG